MNLGSDQGKNNIYDILCIIFCTQYFEKNITHRILFELFERTTCYMWHSKRFWTILWTSLVAKHGWQLMERLREYHRRQSLQPDPPFSPRLSSSNPPTTPSSLQPPYFPLQPSYNPPTTPSNPLFSPSNPPITPIQTPSSPHFYPSNHSTTLSWLIHLHSN